MAPLVSMIPAMGGGGFLSSMLSLGGTFLSAFGQSSQAATTAGLDEANAALMRQNAETARQRAIAVQTEGKEKSRQISEQKRKMIGAQTAAYGGAGVDPGVGTPLKVMADTYGNFERDIQMTGYSTDVNMQLAKSEADMYQYQGDIYSWAAGRARSAGSIGAFTTLLGGVGKTLLSMK